MLNYYFIKSLAIINNSSGSKILSKIFFKNNCGFLSNFYGEIRKFLSTSVSRADDNNTRFLKDNHYVWLKLPKIKSNQLNDLSKKFDKFCVKSEIPKSLRLEIHSKRKNIENIDIIESAEKILPDNVIYLCESYFEKKIKIQNVHVYRNFSPDNFNDLDKNMYGSTDLWHIDGSPTNTLKVFILLHDVKSENGPMEFRNTQSRHLNIIGEKGNILIINTNLIEHRATYPKINQKRDLLCFNLETS